MGAKIRTITAEEWPLWRDLRLQALADAPAAFRGTVEEEARQPDAWWVDLIGSTVDHPRGGLWIGEINDEPLGMLFGRLSPDSQLLSVGAMWVTPPGRNKGIGQDLLATAIEWGRSAGATRVELWVTDENSAATSLYRRAGFLPTREQQPLRPGSPLIVTKFTADL